MGYYGRAAGATLGYIVGNIPGAVAGYKFGERYDKKFPKKMDSGYASGHRKRKLSVGAGRIGKRVKKALFTGKSKRKYLVVGGKRSKYRGRRVRNRRRVLKKKSIGPYTGTFTKLSKVKKSPEAYALSKGFHRTQETYGRVKDPDCVFITQSTTAINEIGFAITAAIVRKLLEKAGFRITNQLVELAVSDPTAGASGADKSTGLKFVVQKKKPTGEWVYYTYNTVDNQTFFDMWYGFTALSDIIIQWMRGSDSTGALVNLFDLHKVSVYIADFTDLTSYYRLGAELYMEDMNIDLHCTTSLVVQNRTLGATSDGNYSTDRTDMQPIKGWIYEFKNGEPRVRHLGNPGGTYNNYQFNMVTDTGIQLIRGAEFSAGKEPFEPKYFANIAKATRVLLQPGEIKKTYLTWKASGKFTNVIKKLRVSTWNIDNLNMTGVFGKSQMICFEELMRTPSTNEIDLSFEREYKVGAVVKESKRQALLESYLTSATLDNPA